MKNIIVLLCDSLSYDEEFFNDMPYLDSIKKNSFIFENYYSQAPYTEAAINSLLSSTNTLDYQGYFNNLKYKPQTINEIFKLLNFKTFNTLWLYPNTKSFLRGVDEYVYADFYSITYYITYYRIQYFKQMYIENRFKSDQKEQLKVLLSDFFEMSEVIKNDYEDNFYRFSLLEKYSTFNKEEFKILINNLDEEKNKFKDDKDNYIINLLTGLNVFFKEDKYDLIKSEQYLKLERKIDFKLKIESIKELTKQLSNYRTNRCIETLNYTFKNLNTNKTFNSLYKWLKYTVNYPFRHAYNHISAKSLFQYVNNYISENKEYDNFILCHIMDNHSPFNFFTNEQDNIENELNLFNLTLKNNSNNLNRFYRASKAYVDENIKEFITRLSKENLLNDSIIIITGDHGSSYMNKIHRTEICSTFYDENYKVPFIVYNPNIKGKLIGNYGISKDFIPTILDLLDNKKEFNIDGISLFKESREFIIFEYNGAGCPDNVIKDKLFCIRGKKYKISYKLSVNNKYNEGEILSIFDLKNDPLELEDKKELLKDEVDVKILLNHLYQRIEEIK